MRLTLNLNGSAEPFINYLKSYLRIRESLLLEIDTNSRAFVAKVFTEDHSSVRFSSLTFDEANISVVSDENENDRNGQRINVGILIKLKKFVQIVERFGDDMNEKGESNFDIIVDYGPMDRKGNDGKMCTDFVATMISFSSDILKMKMDGFRISEFKYLPDDVFMNTVFNVSDSITLPIKSGAISTIIKTSEIIKLDPRKDALVFYVEGSTLYVKDQGETKDSQPNFVYKLGEIDIKPNYDIVLPVSRKMFINMMDKSDEDFNLILGHVNIDGYGFMVDRILFDSTKSATKIAISSLKDH